MKGSTEPVTNYSSITPDGRKTLPFNLERCIAGDPVVTRDGSPYKFGGYNSEAIPPDQLLGWIRQRVVSHHIDGRLLDEPPSYGDLFMLAPEPVVRYANVWPNDIGPAFKDLDICRNFAHQALNITRFSIYPDGTIETEIVHKY